MTSTTTDKTKAARAGTPGKTNGGNRRGESSAIKHSAVVASGNVPRIKVRSVDDATIKWDAVFATYGGHGADQSSTIVYEIEPGGHLGWHTDATEETQYIISGAGELQTEDGSIPGRSRQRLRAADQLGMTSPTPARSRCARSRSLPPRCSRRTSTA